MATLFIVVSPSGKVVYAGPSKTQADFYKPNGFEYENQFYECYSVDATSAWVTNLPADANRGKVGR